MSELEAVAVEFSIKKARKTQSLLSQEVTVKDFTPKEIRFGAGVYAAYGG